MDGCSGVCLFTVHRGLDRYNVRPSFVSPIYDGSGLLAFSATLEIRCPKNDRLRTPRDNLLGRHKKACLKNSSHVKSVSHGGGEMQKVKETLSTIAFAWIQRSKKEIQVNTTIWFVFNASQNVHTHTLAGLFNSQLSNFRYSC